jgi:hypothetical protein
VISPELASLSGNEITPLMQALYFPNRQVRYAAAFALAQSLPTKPFAGSDRVVPLLVEAVNQTSKPGVVILAPATRMMRSPSAICAMPCKASAIRSSPPPPPTRRRGRDLASDRGTDHRLRRQRCPGMISLEQNIARLQGASMLVLTHTPESPWAVASATDLLMNSALIPPKATLKDELKADIDAAREHSGKRPSCPKKKRPQLRLGGRFVAGKARDHSRTRVRYVRRRGRAPRRPERFAAANRQGGRESARDLQHHQRSKWPGLESQQRQRPHPMCASACTKAWRIAPSKSAITSIPIRSRIWKAWFPRGRIPPVRDAAAEARGALRSARGCGARAHPQTVARVVAGPRYAFSITTAVP